eukprot:scaffold2974_cov288-Chaetoceros_neogracile.AAC.1
MAPKTIIITGGTGGIGYQIALALASLPGEQHTIVVTGRNPSSAEIAIATIKEKSKNPNIEFATADLAVQQDVKSLGKELLGRFPKIDELIHNAGNLTIGEKKTTADGIDENVAVNVLAPIILTRMLVPALKAATPTGKVQITSGGLPFDTLSVQNLEGEHLKGGIPSYSHSKRVMEAMTIALSRELESAGIVCNVVGGALPGATGMTRVIAFKDVPFIMKLFYPCVKAFFRRDDGGKSAKDCAGPPIWAAMATKEKLGTGKNYLSGPKEGTFKKEVLDVKNQDIVMEFVASKI